MTPATVHLLAQWIRHSRGIVTEIDKWTAKQEPSRTNREISHITTFLRVVLSSFEYQLSQIDVQEEEVETT